MKRLKHFRKPERDRAYSFWGPAGTGLGVALVLGNVAVSADSISFGLEGGLAVRSLVLGIVLIALGSLALALITKERKVGLAATGLANGLVIFFWGTRVFNALHETNPAIGYGVGWAGIGVGLLLVVLGYIWAPK